MATRNFILFGANERARTVLNTAPVTDRCLFIADNDSRLHGSLFANVPVLPPAAIRTATFDFVRITSGARIPIRAQLLGLGVPATKIRTELFDALEDAPRLQSFAGCHRGRPAFLIGNGPSLRLSDLDRLQARREVSFAFNKVFLAFDRTPYRPTYYMVEDPLVVENNFCAINALRGFPKFIPERLRPWFVAGPETLFYHLVWDICFPRPPRFQPDPAEMYWGSTVIYGALQWAVYMGCNPIYLVGVDFNFIEPSVKEMDGKVMVGEGERNHFLPEYRPAGERWFAPNLQNQLHAFEAARDYAAAHGIQIINATRGGKLDVFPRADFDTITQ